MEGTLALYYGCAAVRPRRDFAGVDMTCQGRRRVVRIIIGQSILLLNRDYSMVYALCSLTSSGDRSCSTRLTTALNTRALFPAIADAKRELFPSSDDFAIAFTYHDDFIVQMESSKNMQHMRSISRAATNNMRRFRSHAPY